VRSDERPHAPKRRHVVKVLGDHQDLAPGAGCLDHLVGLRQGTGDRLLDQYVPVVIESEQDIGEVPVVRGAHDRRPHPRVTDRALVAVEGGHGAERARVGARPRSAPAREG